MWFGGVVSGGGAASGLCCVQDFFHGLECRQFFDDVQILLCCRHRLHGGHARVALLSEVFWKTRLSRIVLAMSRLFCGVRAGVFVGGDVMEDRTIVNLFDDVSVGSSSVS